MLKGSRVAGWAAVALLLGVGLAADAPTRTITVDGLSFEAPEEWKSVKPRSQMIQSQLSVAAVKGDEEPAELTITALRGGGGGVEANVKRWQSQFKDADQNVAKIEQKTVKGQNVDVVRAETAGLYEPPPFARLPKKPGYRLVGAIVQTDDAGYYLKLLGPDKTVTAARPAFDKLLSTIKAGGK